MAQDMIVFLGSGGGRKVLVSQIRSTGGFVIFSDGNQIHVDPGVGAVVKAAQLGVDIRNTGIVLISHSHLDHCNDVNAIIEAVNLDSNNKGVLVTGSFKDTNVLSDSRKKMVKKWFSLKPRDRCSEGNVIIEAVETKDHEGCNIGYKIFTPGFVLGYTSDTSFFPGLVKLFQGSDILIVNTLKPKGLKRKGHMSSDDALKLISGVKPKLAVLYHFGNSMIKANPVYEAREIQRVSGVQTVAAQDGLVIDASSYSVSLKQKTINVY